MKTIQVILFGPLFTQAERKWNRLMKRALEEESNGMLRVTLPQDEAVRFISSETIDFDGIEDNCLRNAETFDVAIAILDGPDADSGTCAEVGYRKGSNGSLLTIGVRTDFRGHEDGGLNLMLHRGTKVRLCDHIVYFPAHFSEDERELARVIIGVIQLKFFAAHTK